MFLYADFKLKLSVQKVEGSASAGAVLFAADIMLLVHCAESADSSVHCQTAGGGEEGVEKGKRATAHICISTATAQTQKEIQRQEEIER